MIARLLKRMEASEEGCPPMRVCEPYIIEQFEKMLIEKMKKIHYIFGKTS